MKGKSIIKGTHIKGRRVSVWITAELRKLIDTYYDGSVSNFLKQAFWVLRDTESIDSKLQDLVKQRAYLDIVLRKFGVNNSQDLPKYLHGHPSSDE